MDQSRAGKIIGHLSIMEESYKQGLRVIDETEAPQKVKDHVAQLLANVQEDMAHLQGSVCTRDLARME